MFLDGSGVSRNGLCLTSLCRVCLTSLCRVYLCLLAFCGVDLCPLAFFDRGIRLLRRTPASVCHVRDICDLSESFSRLCSAQRGLLCWFTWWGYSDSLAFAYTEDAKATSISFHRCSGYSGWILQRREHNHNEHRNKECKGSRRHARHSDGLLPFSRLQLRFESMVRYRRHRTSR